MPKLTKIRRYDPPNLLDKFQSFDIKPVSNSELSSAKKYKYTDSESLLFWVRFTSGAPTLLTADRAKGQVALTNSNSSPVFNTQEKVYSSRMQCALLGKVADNNLITARFQEAQNVLSFGNGSAESQKPFTFSLWFRKRIPETDDVSTDYLFVKGRPRSAAPNDNFEYQATIASGRVRFTLFDASSLSEQTLEVSPNWDLNDTSIWHHLVFIYDGSPGNGTDDNTANLGLGIYINGELQTVRNLARTHSGSGYTGIEQKSDFLFFGDNPDTTGGSSDIAIAEFAAWNKVLSSDSIKAIYNWTRQERIVKSGYTNLPPRVRLRNADNRPGCYPTKHRMGDKDRSGKNNIFYDDLVLPFANEIKDDFTNVPDSDLVTDTSGFDSTKWAVSPNMTIRREAIQSLGGATIIDRCVTFSGNITTGRFLRSVKKIRNPYRFYFELLEGPYNRGFLFLNLSAGKLSETLKLQISTDKEFTSPTTIATYTPSENPTNNYTLIGPNKKPRRIISLSTKDFPDLGEPYYFRFIQETTTNNKFVWAIANIEVEYANQNIRYPLLLNHSDNAGNKIANSFLGNSNASGSLTAAGRSVKGISDLGNPFQDFSETISAFNETLVIENAEDEFFNQGMNPALYPGFSSPARSKTKITVDLSPSEPTTFGYMTKLSNAFSSVSTDTSAIGQNLMVYWNNDLKRWEKIGKQLHAGHATQADHDAHIELFKNALTSSCLGFGPASLAQFSGDDSSNLTFLNKSFLAQSYKKTDLYTFPFGPQYFGTSSYTIKAKDIGITKPFLLEKTSIEFDATFNFDNYLDSFEQLFAFHYHDTDIVVNPSTRQLLRSIGTVTPTFFMLRQFNDSFYYSAKENTDRADGIVPVNFEIPGNFAITQGSDHLTFVDKNRELITYKNLQLFVSRSRGHQTRPDGTHFSLDDFIAAGMKGDANEMYSYPNPGFTDPIPSLTKRFMINANTKMRTISPDKMSAIRILDDTGATGFYTRNRTGKSNSQLKSNRSIVNGFSSILRVSEATIPGFNSGDDLKIFNLPAEEDIEKQHLYLILPNDDLIFGWQYPVGKDPVAGSPGSDATNFCTMQLFGNSKLHLYGSEIVNNKEYHETVNQNLTSCAVYEHVIGDEKVVDQWQVAYRGELTGSVSTVQLYEYDSLEDAGRKRMTYNPQAWHSSYGKYINYDRMATFDKSFNSIEHNKGIKRIGIQVVCSTPSYKDKIYNLTFENTRKVAIDASEPAFDAATRTPYAVYWVASGAIPIIAFFDNDRSFTDGNVPVGNYYDDSSYGTLSRNHTSTFWGVTEDLNNNPERFFNKGPRYVFNSNHFGHYADMMQQGHDSKFKTKPRRGFTTGFDIVVNSRSPIKIQFVSGSFKDNPSIKTYVKKDVESYLDEIGFQSANLSTSATSSMPFIDDNQPHNRTYLTEAFIAVTS